MKPVIVLENIRSAYNVGNIIRTADAFGYDVLLSGYTPHPDDGKVSKTSLGAEDFVGIRQSRNPMLGLKSLREEGYQLIAAEYCKGSIPLDEPLVGVGTAPLAIVVGNEVEGVLPETLEFVNYIVHIPMVGEKDSLNVGQAAAIMMWELKKYAL